MISEREARKTIPRVLRALEKKHGEPPPLSDGDALEMAIRVVLHEDRSEKAAASAIRNLQRDFADWNEVRVSTPYQVATAIDSNGEAETKALEVQALLSAAFSVRNEISLEFLREASAAEAAEFFEEISELGPVLTGKILMLVLGHSSIIVSPEVIRVCQRLDWIREDYDDVQIQKRLERLVPKSAMYQLYHVCREHARKICQAQDPKCRGCPVLKFCPFGREATRTRKSAGAAKKKSSTHRK